MSFSEKELVDAFQKIAERLNEIHDSLSELGVGLAAVKTILAVHLHPSNPLQASKQIANLEEDYRKLHPTAEARKRRSDAIEMAKIIEKHGGPKQA